MQRVSFAAVLRVILTFLYVALSVILQCSVFPYLRLFGVIPEFTLCAIVCVACCEDERVSCILAVCAGFLLDTVGGDKYTLSPFLFLLAAALSIILSKNVFSKKILPALISGVTALTVGALKTTLILVISGAPFIPALIKTALPQFVYGMILLLPVFLLTALHYRIFKNSLQSKQGFYR